MSHLSFIASLVASLSWPVVVIVAIVLFRKSLSELILRVRSYKGMGQELEFGERLAVAEESAKLALESVPESVESKEQESLEELETGPRLLIREAESNPSYAVIRAWEELESVLANLAGVVLPRRIARRGGTARLLADLETSDTFLTKQYYDAVREHRDLRNRVAHGQNKPSPGEAIAYVQSIDELTAAARYSIDFSLKQRKSDEASPARD